MECLYSLEVEPGAVGGAHHADLDRAAGYIAQHGAGCLQIGPQPAYTSDGAICGTGRDRGGDLRARPQPRG